MNPTEFSLPSNSDNPRLDILLKALRIASTESAMADNYPELAMEQYQDIVSEVRVLQSVERSIKEENSTGM